MRMNSKVKFYIFYLSCNIKYGQSGYREYAPIKKAKQIMFTMHILPLLNFNLSSLFIFNIFTNTIIICLKKKQTRKDREERWRER